MYTFNIMLVLQLSDPNFITVDRYTSSILFLLGNPNNRDFLLRLDSFTKLPNATINFIIAVCLFIRPSVRWNNCAVTGGGGGDFHEYWYLINFQNCQEKLHFY
jgi:hypothetical protein